MNEKPFNCVLGKDYHIINNNVDNMTYFLQDRNDVVLVINLLNKLYEENEQLRKELDNFKPVMFQDVRKGTVILYSKGDTDEQSSLKVKASSKTVKDD